MISTKKSNRTELREDHAVIYGREGSAIVCDLTDLDLLSGYSWCVRTDSSGKKRVFTNIYKGNRKCESVSMASIIMGQPKGLVVDHISGDTLDHKRTNLRVTTQAQNSCNRKLNSNNRSGYKGVIQSGKRWIAVIYHQGQRIQLGYFEKKEAAAEAYNKEAKKRFGEFARLNELTE